MTGRRDILASRVEELTLTANTQDPAQASAPVASLKLTLPGPPKTGSVRVVIETEEEGRMGTVDPDRQTIHAALALPTPNPQLVPRPPHPEGLHGAP